ncbi:glycoside hydrolase family 16 protein [Chitinophaga alhagiae]|uniref:glycoside hydrolase family 16 protein n=1 Tax=Chitinophaga alhagiae TaxID=2203219 RepID=UPI000E5AFF26|nr:glycoside hydrolase family 16 protein [Chitinophaga alhagiae]
MKYLFLAAAALLASQSCRTPKSATASLIWADEFNTTGAPDPQKWDYATGTGNNGWGNAEAQYYTNRPENVEVSGGTLKIKARKEQHNGSGYTSARLLTKGKFSFRYGKIEVRAKLPAGGGTWPAIWMLGNNISEVGWPACGEIDIMEHKGNEPGKIHGTLHYPGHSGAHGSTNTTMISNASSAFHIYTVDWTAAALKFYIDGNLFYTFNNSANVPFNQEFYVLLNLAMGGHFGGKIDPAFNSAVFEIDYVRVYRN